MSRASQWRQPNPDRSRGTIRDMARPKPKPDWVLVVIEWAGVALLLAAASAIGASWAIIMQAPAHAERPASP